MKDLLLGNCNFAFISTNMVQSKSGFQSLFKMKVRMRIKKEIYFNRCVFNHSHDDRRMRKDV